MDPAAATPGLAAKVRHDLGDIDLAVLGCYLNLTHPDEAAYRDTLRRYRAHIQLARWMNAGCVGTETGNPNVTYSYDPARSHTPEALEMFMRRVAPVVESAENFGVTLAIEPVYTHIVHDGKAARKALSPIGVGRYEFEYKEVVWIDVRRVMKFISITIITTRHKKTACFHAVPPPLLQSHYHTKKKNSSSANT
jgi:hypothetical protein